MSLARRFLAGLVILILVLLIGSGIAAMTTVPWPSHIEWSVFTVDRAGYIVVSPVEVDSLGNHEALPLPPGTEIYVPHLVKGESQEEMKARKAREL